MGMKRGNLESVGIGALAQAANPRYHQKNSVAAGLGALARGVEALADGLKPIRDGLGALSDAMWKFGEFATIADRIKKYNIELEAQMRQKAVQARADGEPEWKVTAIEDEARKAKYRADNVSLFGVLTTPDPTWGIDKDTDEGKAQLNRRKQVYEEQDRALGVKEENLGKKKTHSFGTFDWLWHEEGY